MICIEDTSSTIDGVGCRAISGCIACDTSDSSKCSLCDTGSIPVDGKCSCDEGMLLIGGKCVE